MYMCARVLVYICVWVHLFCLLLFTPPLQHKEITSVINRSHFFYVAKSYLLF